jgi:hypothetical protein
MTTSSNADPEIIRRLVIIVVVIFAGLYLGMKIPSQPEMATAVLVLCGLLFLLFARPTYFALLLLVFLFEAFDLVDVERFGRLPGLFRAKDVLIFLAVGYVVANASLHNPPAFRLRDSRLFKPMVAYILFVVFQMWRTKVLLHESPLLLFRAGRLYLTYGLPFLLFFFFRRERDWVVLDRLFLFAIAVTTVLIMAGSVLGPLPLLSRFGGATAQLGVFKSYNPAGQIVYWYFFRFFWRFCQEPRRKNLFALAAVGVATMMYFHRSMISGVLVGISMALFAVPARVRVRAVTVLVLLAVMLVALTVVGVAFSQTTSAGEIALALKNYILSTATDLFRVEGTYRSRVTIDTERYPLVKQHPFLGIGFLSVFGNVAYSMWKTEGTLPVGTVDTGWLDLMLRLGGVGTLFLLILLLQCLRINWGLYVRNKVAAPRDRSILLANICFIVASIASSVASGTVVWEPGITTIAIGFAWTMKIEHEAAKPAEIQPAAKPVTAPSEARGFRTGPLFG